MKLYRCGFGQYKWYVGAENEHEAIVKVQNERNMLALPVVAEEVKEDFGMSINIYEEVKTSLSAEVETVQEVEEVKETPKSICKKCDKEFDNKGEFLAHSRKCGKEV